MSTGKKVLNVLGIILAWFLSITLVLLLFVSPVFLSAMSVVKPRELVDAVTDIEIPQIVAALGEDILDTENEQIMEFLSTDAVQELFETYVTGVLGVLEGEAPQEILTEEKIWEIVHTNIDELYAIIVKEAPELAALPEEEAKQQVETLLCSSLLELTAELPSPETMIQELVAQEPAIETALNILEQTDTIKLSFVMVIVVLSALIFVCRLFGFRGFRWLSVDLFVASGFSALTCAGLAMSASAVEMLVGESQMAALFVGKLITGFSNGVYIRTGIMLASAIVLLVVYILIKKAIAKKRAAVVPAVPVEPEQALQEEVIVE